MTIRAKSVAFAGALLVVAIPVAFRQTSGDALTTGAPAVAGKASELPGVRVEHEFITVTQAGPPAISAPAVRVVQPVRRTITEPRTLAAKTKRAFLGDGRHRPLPFPTAR